MEPKLDGVAMVSGASSDLGLALCTALSVAGARPVGLAHSKDGLARLKEKGIAAFVSENPESAPETGAALAGDIPRYFIDLAATRFESMVSAASPDAIMDWARDDIAIRARLLRAMTRAMLARRRGRCLFISSVAAGRPGVGQAYYAAAKVAGETLFASVGVEMARRGITACSLRLSWIAAGRGKTFLAGREQEVAALMPTRRLVGAEDAIATMLFLLSDAAADINATTITLDGGFSVTKPDAGQNVKRDDAP